MDNESMIRKIQSQLKVKIGTLPPKFYDSFEFTKRGRNLTHPITLGLLVGIVSDIRGVGFVGVDMRLNDRNSIKFQPDIVGFTSDVDHGRHVIYVDYESPNSSDSRVPKKDIRAYEKWSKDFKGAAPYLVITTLPDFKCEGWEARYSKKNRLTRSAEKEKLRENPFKYWKRRYLRWEKFPKNVYWLNLSGKDVVRVKT